MRCIAVLNQKGGVGKTTTAVNLGAALAQRGQRCLMADLDPQGHLTAHFGVDAGGKSPGAYELLAGSAKLRDAIRKVDDQISVIGTSIDLAATEVELAGTIGREMIFRDLLAAEKLPFDWLLIDCPPSLGVLTLNALCAAQEVLIPLQAHFLGLQGVGRLFDTVKLVAKRINPGLRVLGLLLCMHEQSTRLAAEVVDDLDRFLTESRGQDVPWREARIFATRIRRNVKLAECPSYGQTIFQYAPKSHGAEDYLAVADELMGVSTPAVPVAVVQPAPVVTPALVTPKPVVAAVAAAAKTVTATKAPVALNPAAVVKPVPPATTSPNGKPAVSPPLPPPSPKIAPVAKPAAVAKLPVAPKAVVAKPAVPAAPAPVGKSVVIASKTVAAKVAAIARPATLPKPLAAPKPAIDTTPPQTTTRPNNNPAPIAKPAPVGDRISSVQSPAPAVAKGIVPPAPPKAPKLPPKPRPKAAAPPTTPTEKPVEAAVSLP